MRPVPYALDTCSKGWRFELDIEQITQSDTRALCPPEMRPWLLTILTVSWTQLPCGSLPADDARLCALFGMPAKLFAKHKDALLRGWWMADDGRLYHDTVTLRVLDMLKKRTSERDRKAAWRKRKEVGQTVLKLVTKEERKDTTEVILRPTRAGAVCMSMKAEGIAGVNPYNQRLLVLLEHGAEVQDFVDAARIAVGKNKGHFAYVLGIVKNCLFEKITQNGASLHDLIAFEVC